MSRIGVVGDIHGNYWGLKQALQQMGPIDRLLFTGDGYREISKFQNDPRLVIEGVAGNCDLYTEYPPEQVFYLGKWKILLTHGHLHGVKSGLTRLVMVGRELGVNLVVFGHTHRPLSAEWEGLRLFNPGSLSEERSYQGPTYGIIEISDSGILPMINRL